MIKINKRVEYYKEYYKNHREEKREYDKQRYQNNREEKMEKGTLWNKNNPEKRKIINKKYDEIHRDVILKRRYPYRYIMEKILNRRLINGEEIHHIDMNNTNNDSKNLYVYINKSEHRLGHGSINKLIAKLLERNIIEFKSGRYCLKGEIE